MSGEKTNVCEKTGVDFLGKPTISMSIVALQMS